MTTTHEREHELQAFLRQRADMVDVPGDFAPVAIAKRRRDRRNRAVLGAVAAVAAVAVVVPAVWSRQGPGPSPAPATTTPTSLSATSTAVPTQTATTQTATTPPPNSASTPPPATGTVGPPASAASVDIAFGPVTGINDVAYAVAGVLHDGGRTLRLPVTSGIRYLARLEKGGALVHAPADGRPESTFVVDPSGTTVMRLSDVQDVRANADGSRFATVDGMGTIHLRDSAAGDLASLKTGDINAGVSGFFGDTVYYTVVDAAGRTSTRAWDSASGSTRALTAGRLQAVHEGRGLALVWPNQDYNPDNTCYSILDLRTLRSTKSCGAFAPSHFAAGGTVVVGAEVADGPGTSVFKIASVDGGQILGRFTIQGGAWSPSWVGDDSRALVLTLFDGESPTKQTVASCSSVPMECTVDLDAVSVTAAQRDAMEWPIVLSDN